jgi:hypothetical protein
MRYAALLLIFAIALSSNAQTTAPSDSDVPSDVIDRQPEVPKRPDPPAGFAWWIWWQAFPGKESKLYQGIRPIKNPKRPKHKKPTPCELQCAITYIDFNTDEINKELSQEAHEKFTLDTESGAVEAMRNASMVDESSWPKNDPNVIDADGFYEHGSPLDHGISLRTTSLQAIGSTETAWVLAHEAMHYMIDHANGDSLRTIDPPFEGAYTGEDWQDYFIYHYMQDHPMKCDCDK